MTLLTGTCTTGQLTAAGLHDSYHHGRDISAVYGPKGVNPLLPERFCDDNEEKHAILVRTSPEPRTIDVASGVLRGMGCPKEGIIPAHTHPDTIVSDTHYFVALTLIQSDGKDGIVPSYACSYTDDLRQKIEVRTYVIFIMKLMFVGGENVARPFAKRIQSLWYYQRCPRHRRRNQLEHLDGPCIWLSRRCAIYSSCALWPKCSHRGSVIIILYQKIQKMKNEFHRM